MCVLCVVTHCESRRLGGYKNVEKGPGGGGRG